MMPQSVSSIASFGMGENNSQASRLETLDMYYLDTPRTCFVSPSSESVSSSSLVLFESGQSILYQASAGAYSLNAISVGASSALFGLLGPMLSELLINWTTYDNKGVALVMLLVIVGVNLALGTLPPVSNFAHIGGFIGGFLLGFLLLIHPQFEWEENRVSTLVPGSVVKPKYNICQLVLCIAAATVFVAGFVSGLMILSRGDNLNRYCKRCHKLSYSVKSQWT
ncbi:unnamed protein product [Thlaspi arvense]|uniref:RHOMBOID-like protein n=1 Tax=Thlaspi arvense TaxID=13288 RepID=A0AAU9T1W3_THLAR|nr:unnamed protein product [Thlaspi arvense]